MNNEQLPIKFFTKRKVDELRVEGGGNQEIPKWYLEEQLLVERANNLFNELSGFEEALIKKRANESMIPFIFVGKICTDSTAKSRRSEITNFFQIGENNNVIGMVGSDKLLIKIDSKEDIKEISQKLKNPKQNISAISCLEHFNEYEPLSTIQEENQNYKIKLINFQEYELNKVVSNFFEKFCFETNIDFKKTFYADDYIIYKIVNMSKVSLDIIQKNEIYNAIFSISPMPKYFVSLDSVANSNEIKILNPNSNENYVTIGILDNGIAKIPHLSPWLINNRWAAYPDSCINPTHGTFVAGIILYGDILESKNWVGNKGVRIFDATVYPDTSVETIEEDQLIENIIEAVKQNYQNISIWNLSLSIARQVKDNNFSDFAIALDNLQDHYNILICKSAGNCNNFINGLPKQRINEGADSIRALVVGSIAHEKNVYDISDIDNPSPFSRIGPGPEYIIKPEVTHYGGNAGIDPNGKIHQTGVKSFNQDGSISLAVGTSFSTPRITSLIAGLFQEMNEDFNPLLLKALVIHSSSYSKDLKIPNKERTKQLGFGKPLPIKQILYNSPSEATLILCDSLAKGQVIDIMDFPMPNCLIKDGFFTGQIIATLVYDPILDPSQGAEYCQSNIDIKFGSYDKKKLRDTSKKTILNPVGREGSQNLFSDSLYSKNKMKNKLDDFSLKERLLIKYADKYYPVKKYAVDLTELSDKKKYEFLPEDRHWYLWLRGLYRDFIERKSVQDNIDLIQKFCLVITIRDPLEKSNVYDEVSQKLDEYHFWHNNIKLSSDINVEVKE